MKKLLLSLLCLAGLTANAAEVTDVLTAESLKAHSNYSATSTQYTTFEVTGESGAEYALQCAHNKGTCIQLRSSNNNSGIVTTKSAGKVVSVAVTYASNTADKRTLNIYGYNTEIATPAGLYGTSAPSVLGTIVYGTSTSYTFGEDFDYVGMRSNSGAMYIDKIEITWETGSDVAVARPAFSVAPGVVDEGTQVEITCETEGAEIYYTLDGTTPTNASTKYTEAITINETTTVMAIAYVGEEASAVASATYEVPEKATLEEVLGMANGETFVMGTELTVVDVPEGDTRYIYVYGDGLYSLIYDADRAQTLKKGDVIKKGWEGKVSIYRGLFEMTATETLAVADEAGSVPTPKTVDAADINLDLMNNMVVVKNVVFAEATPADANNFTGTVGETDLTFRNTFKVAAVDAGTYDVTCVVSVFTSSNNAAATDADLQLLPISYELATSGIADIETEDNVAPVYYNLQGVRVANPEKGLFIEVRGDKATKVIK